MGRDSVLRSEPPRSVPGQFSTLARQSRAAICCLANKYVWRSAHVQVYLTLVTSCRDHHLRLSSKLGVANYGWAYKESYNECYHAICLLHRQCCRTVHVES